MSCSSTLQALCSALREFAVAPVVGRTAAQLIEAPFMIAAVYVAARWVTGRRSPPWPRTALAAVGGIAFGCLVVLEVLLSSLLRGWFLAQWLSHFISIEGAISLALFLLFAAVPMLVGNAQARS